MSTPGADDRWTARGLVAAQFGLLFALLWQTPILAAGWPRFVQAAAIGLGLWAGWTMTRVQRRMFSITPLPDAHPRLARSGPYRLMRHPMYAAIEWFFIPVALQSGAIAIALVIALSVVLSAKYRFEERALMRKFADYEHYRASTGALWPRLKSLLDHE